MKQRMEKLAPSLVSAKSQTLSNSSTVTRSSESRKCLLTKTTSMPRFGPSSWAAHLRLHLRSKMALKVEKRNSASLAKTPSSNSLCRQRFSRTRIDWLKHQRHQLVLSLKLANMSQKRRRSSRSSTRCRTMHLPTPQYRVTAEQIISSTQFLGKPWPFAKRF